MKSVKNDKLRNNLALITHQIKFYLFLYIVKKQIVMSRHLFNKLRLQPPFYLYSTDIAK